MIRSFCVTIMLAVLILPFSLNAETSTENILALEKKVNDLQRTYMNNNRDVASAVARAQTLHEEWSQLNGRIDANTHLISSQYDNLMKSVISLDHRIQSIEDRMSIFSEQLSVALRKLAPEQAAEGDLYQSGLDLANQAKYLEAASAFSKFLKKYKKSKFAPNASFWIGECFYASRDYQRSIKEFQNFIEKYPRDKNISSAILKQGNSFYELGMLEEAKAFYQKVMTSYSQTTSAEIARQKIAHIKDREAKQNKATSSGMDSYPTETIQQKSMRGKKFEKNTKPDTKNGARHPIREF